MPIIFSDLDYPHKPEDMKNKYNVGGKNQVYAVVCVGFANTQPGPNFNWIEKFRKYDTFLEFGADFEDLEHSE